MTVTNDAPLPEPLPEPLLLRAARGQAVPRPPVWLMRQAGRFLPEYRAVRQRMGTLEMFRTPEVACDITLQPLARFPLDGAIVYADILHIPDALGLGLSFREGEGPVFQSRVQTLEDVARLRARWMHEREDVMAGLCHVGATLKLVRQRLDPSKTLIGFAGAPWTVACYMIEGRGSHGEFFEAKRLASRAPEVVVSLVDLVADMTIDYLKMQMESGAQIVQIFESWAMALTPSAFERFAAPAVRRILDGLSTFSDVPKVYFVNGIGGLVSRAAALGSDVLGVDWRVDLAEVAQTLEGLRRSAAAPSLPGRPAVLQGNFDPIMLFASENAVRREVQRIVQSMQGQSMGHIFNLGHGLRPETPVEAVGWLVDEVMSGCQRG
jgi:uroporphyrinogen decarboxylase